MSVTKNGTYCYRDALVQKIKDAGKDLIERAEEMVSEKNQLNTGFSITIDFPQGETCEPRITYTTETLVKSYLKREFDMFTEEK